MSRILLRTIPLKSSHDIVVPFSALLDLVIVATDVNIEPTLFVSCTVMSPRFISTLRSSEFKNLLL